jgi:hypothetical protein
MSPRRVRGGEWLAGAAGAALIVSLFLDWYTARPAALSGWEAFAVTDVLLALLALSGPVLLVLQAAKESPALPTGASIVCATCGALAAALVLVRLLVEPQADRVTGLEYGAWIGLASALALLAGGWWSLESEHNPGAPVPPVEVRRSPAAPGS